MSALHNSKEGLLDIQAVHEEQSGPVLLPDAAASTNKLVISREGSSTPCEQWCRG